MTDPRADPDYAGHWRWDGRTRRLSLDVEAESAVSDLQGIWSLDGLGAMLDGFSRNRLLLSLAGTDGAVNCSLGVSDGRAFQLVGAFIDASEAQGLILLGDGQDTDPEEDALPGPSLEPVFQPIVAVGTGQIVGFEALARWQADIHQMGAAKRFEDDGLATNMLIRAVEALDRFRKESDRSDLFIHVNLTGRDLEQSGLSRLVDALVEGYGLQNGGLRIELTEQAALRDAGDALVSAKRLKAAGAGLVLDDFGTGHSSFAWLADLPADGIKVDSALTARLGEPRTDIILRAVRAMAHELGMTITGEGVEAAWQLSALQTLGFDYAQGFFFARPMSQARALTYLLDDQARPGIE